MSSSESANCLENGTSHELKKQKDNSKSITSLQKISIAITGTLENFFFRWGFTVATHPYKFITICLLSTVICALGFYNFQQEIRPDKLIIPQSSEFAKNTDWLRTNSPSPLRENNAILTAKNILSPEVFRTLFDLHQSIKSVTIKNGKSWNDLCFRLPITKFDSRRRRRSAELKKLENSSSVEKSESKEDAFQDDFFNDNSVESSSPSSGSRWDAFSNIPEDLYCPIVNSLKDACYEINPVELFSFDKSLIYNLTQEEIIHVMNHQLISPIFGRSVNYSALLGGNIVKNDQGEIISAPSILLKWSVTVNRKAIADGKGVSDDFGEIVDPECLEWEAGWINIMKKFSKSLPPDIKLNFVNQRSWADISQEALKGDGVILACGFLVMFIYVGMMLGRFNLIEQRPFLTAAGLSCILFSLIVTTGICSSFSIKFMTLNRILPFLLLGIGIDDMFVIMQCWNNLFPSPLTVKSKFSIAERMGFALKSAGVSITVTSLTDVAAFSVGASTNLPCLKSFCIHAAIGIISIYIFQVTFFVAIFALDQKRLEERRNAYIYCIKYPENHLVSNKSEQKSYSQIFFDKILSRYLLKNFTKVFVILFTVGFAAVGIYGNILLRQHFDISYFLPGNSYMVKFMHTRTENYPKIGSPAVLIAHNVNWSASLGNYGNFIDSLKASPDIYKFEEWYGDFKVYCSKSFGIDIDNRPLTPRKFDKYMGKYLFSPSGAKYKYYFTYHGNFSCGDSLPPIKAIILPFRFAKFEGSDEHIPAMNRLKSLTKNANLTFNSNVTDGKFFYWSPTSVAWEADEIIKGELYRNLGLSLSSVLGLTLFLLADLRLCFCCGLCVILTLIDVGACMHFWGLTIDGASVTILILAVGLCVDYAAHICLAFMKSDGSKVSRAKEAVRLIGPAVFHGGFSTFLGVVFLANAQTRVIESFFKIFTLVVFIGLFHGLIFLPVLLSIIGPEPYPFSTTHVLDTRMTDYETQKSFELHPLTNGSSGNHAKEAFSLNNDLKDNNALSAKEPPLLSDLSQQIMDDFSDSSKPLTQKHKPTRIVTSKKT